MCTQREILQNDLLRPAKLGPWQKEKQQLKMGVLFYFSVFSVVFSLRSFFFYRTNKGALYKDRNCKKRLQNQRLQNQTARLQTTAKKIPESISRLGSLQSAVCSLH